MSRVFRDVLVTVEPTPNAHELMDCMEELQAIYEENPKGPKHAVFAQVYSSKDSAARFYLTGKILTPSQALRIRDILGE